MLLLIFIWYIYGLVQDCSNSSALAMELLQSCTKPSIYKHVKYIPYLPHSSGCFLWTGTVVWLFSCQWNNFEDMVKLDEVWSTYFWMKCTSVNVWVRYIVWDTSENVIFHNVDNLRTLRFRNWCAFNERTTWSQRSIRNGSTTNKKMIFLKICFKLSLSQLRVNPYEISHPWHLPLLAWPPSMGQIKP